MQSLGSLAQKSQHRTNIGYTAEAVGTLACEHQSGRGIFTNQHDRDDNDDNDDDDDDDHHHG